MQVNFIDDPAKLDAWQVPSGAGSVAFDTEFVRERTYYAQLGLIQLAAGDQLVLFDPLGDGGNAALGRLIARSPILVMHSASEDLEALWVACKRLPETLFDTQIAAAVAGMGAGLGLQKLIETTLGVVLAKSETRTDWTRRPLSVAQLAYAADDVRYLGAAADALSTRLAQLGRTEWVAEDCARMLAAAASDEDNPHPHLNFRPAQRLAPDAQRRLCRLLRWRDAQARASNRPRGWVLENSLALRIAECPPMDSSALETLLATNPGAPRKHRERLWEIIARPFTAEERDMPLASRGDAADKAILKLMQDAVAKQAALLGLPEGLLAARRHLEAMLIAQRWPLALEGWRRPLLEPALSFAIR